MNPKRSCILSNELVHPLVVAIGGRFNDYISNDVHFGQEMDILCQDFSIYSLQRIKMVPFVKTRHWPL
jgi:hypothetical protein